MKDQKTNVKVKAVKLKPPTWRYVFYGDHKRYGYITNFFEVVKETGYPYACWNGRIYEVKSDGLKGTDWLSVDIK